MDYHKFSDFADEPQGLNGDKIKIDDAINKELVITAFRVDDSKYHRDEGKKYVGIQVLIDEQERVIFTGSAVLINQLEKYQDKIPFVAVIKKVNKYYTLS